jgi:hypothetical protein
VKFARATPPDENIFGKMREVSGILARFPEIFAVTI